MKESSKAKESMVNKKRPKEIEEKIPIHSPRVFTTIGVMRLGQTSLAREPSLRRTEKEPRGSQRSAMRLKPYEKLHGIKARKRGLSDSESNNAMRYAPHIPTYLLRS